MTTQDALRLIALAAIWGGSFIFMRVLAPVLGPIVTADLRVLLAGMALILYFWVIGVDLDWRRHWRHYLVMGGVGSALPFVLFSFAALHIPASCSVIFNSTSPLFGAVFSALWLRDPLTWRKGLGLFLGAAGVAIVSRVSTTPLNTLFYLSLCACLGSALCYGLAGVYMKRFAPTVNPRAMAGGSQTMAGLLLLPLWPLSPVPGVVTLPVVWNILALALLCSGVAYLLYYRLIADVGPTKALTVTFLMPVFGMLWGALFLGEVITLEMMSGAALIIGGTHFVVKKV